MTVKKWAVKVGDLRPLSRAGQILFAARCALRVAPWVPSEIEPLWREALGEVVHSAFQPPEESDRSGALSHELMDVGASACNDLADEDEPLGRCINFAACTLAAAAEAQVLDGGSDLRKHVVEVAKQSASIPAVLAHAGRVTVPAGADAVDTACITMWDAIKADVAVLVEHAEAIGGTKDRVNALAECAPLWPDSVPDWVPSA